MNEKQPFDGDLVFYHQKLEGFNWYYDGHDVTHPILNYLVTNMEANKTVDFRLYDVAQYCCTESVESIIKGLGQLIKDRIIRVKHKRGKMYQARFLPEFLHEPVSLEEYEALEEKMSDRRLDEQVRRFREQDKAEKKAKKG